MIDDIIEFVDNEDEEGVIIFVDQEKAFDRMGVVKLCYGLFFNFGLIFREWVYMLFKRGKTCIKQMVSYQTFSQYRVHPDKDFLLHRYCTLFRQGRWIVLSEAFR
jgi:hypothetical protein